MKFCDMCVLVRYLGVLKMLVLFDFFVIVFLKVIIWVVVVVDEVVRSAVVLIVVESVKWVCIVSFF